MLSRKSIHLPLTILRCLWILFCLWGAGLNVLALDFAAPDRRMPAGLPPGASPARTPEAPGFEGQLRLAQGVVLIAKKSITEPNFARTVLLITEYRNTGTLGLILNRPLDKLATEALPQLKELNLPSLNLYLGGPVRLNSLRLLVQTDMALDGHYPVFDDVFQITDLSGIRRLLRQKSGQFRLRLYAGFAGWSPGQLEQELLRGDWHLSRADTSMIFMENPETLWEELIEQMDMHWVNRNDESGAGMMTAPCGLAPGKGLDEGTYSQRVLNRPGGLSSNISKRNIYSITYY